MNIITAIHNVLSATRLSMNDGTSEVSIIEAWKDDFWLEVLSITKALQVDMFLYGRALSMRDSLKSLLGLSWTLSELVLDFLRPWRLRARIA